jgi:GntR family transcriptional regulator
MDAVDTSKTHRLYMVLKEGIISGALATGQRLPSEPELAIAHGVSRVTVRRSLDGLERDRLIRRQPGAGTFILGVDPHKAVVADLSNMLAHLVAMGRATRVKLLEFDYDNPAPAIAAALLLNPGERTQRSVRVRYLDDVPFSHLVTHVPERIGVTYTEADLTTTPLLCLLERSGVVADRATQNITATLAGPQISQILGVEIGSPLISLNRVVFDAEGRGVEHLSALYRPDVHSFEMELTRTGRGADRRWSPVSKAAGNVVTERALGRQPKVSSHSQASPRPFKKPSSPRSTP